MLESRADVGVGSPVSAVGGSRSRVRAEGVLVQLRWAADLAQGKRQRLWDERGRQGAGASRSNQLSRCLHCLPGLRKVGGQKFLPATPSS